MSHENGKPKPTSRDGQQQLINEMGEECFNFLFADGSFDTTPRKLFQIMTHQEAAMMTYLIALAKMNEVSIKENGYVYCHHVKAETELNICRSSQTRIISNFRKKGYVDMDYIAGRRKLKINYEAIIDAIRDAAKKSKILSLNGHPKKQKHYRDRGSARSKALP